MRHRNTGTSRKRYEYGDCTVFVRASSYGILDGLVRCNFSCEVHPADGRPVLQVGVRAFYSWHAANMALDIFHKKQHNERTL